MTVHTVRPHETITSIARHYHVTAKALTSSNHLNDANFIQVGQSLQIPRARNLNTPNVADPKPVKQATQAKDHGHTEHFIEDITEAIELGYVITNGWLDELLQRLRHREANESVQHTEPVKFTPAPTPALPLTSPPTNKSSYSLKKLIDVKKDLQERLGKDPHVITFNGVKLTQNERMQIIASVACCEMSKDGFGSINADQEFVGRKFKHRGIETGYSRIVLFGIADLTTQTKGKAPNKAPPQVVTVLAALRHHLP